MVETGTNPKLAKKSRIDAVEVFELNSSNFNKIWPFMMVSLKSADCVAIDLELSGLGSRQRMSTKNIEERYGAIRDAAMSRSILSIGLAFFKLDKKNEEKRTLSYRVQVFNILSLCSDPFTIEPEALAFLAKHSFDFNRLITSGVHYYPSNVSKSCPIRSLIKEVLSSAVPLAFHNGFVDLIFLYHHFYSPLPESYAQFCNALNDLFPEETPVLDSKYMAEYSTRMKGSFLEYVFRKCQADNVREAISGKWSFCIKFDDTKDMMDVLKDARETVNCPLPKNFPNHVIPCDLAETVCPQYANHGFCRVKDCNKLHDVDFALDLEYLRSEKERRKRKRRYEHLDIAPKKDGNSSSDSTNQSENKVFVAQITDKPRIAVTGCHRAGIDAFMTGFAVLFQSRMSLVREGDFDKETINKIPLSGKDLPLHIHPTKFGGTCPKHEERFACLAGARQRNLETKKPPL